MKAKRTSILVVDDDSAMRKLMQIYLNAEEFKVEEATGAQEAIRMVASSVKTDLILLDLGLMDEDGIEVIRAVRQWSMIPIIVVSGREDEKNVVEVLEAGANDYIIKPFSKEVLKARINVQLRQSVRQENGEVTISNGRINVDLMSHKVFIDGKHTMFTPKEHELLVYFIKNKNKLLLHGQILKEVWGAAHIEDLHYLRVYVSQLREKIETDPEHPAYIITEPGLGYRMETISEAPQQLSAVLPGFEAPEGKKDSGTVTPSSKPGKTKPTITMSALTEYTAH
ncbi:MAG: response regulator [Alphaproteobacteria bacterium]|nr:response regulator [Alphaproteobacteria bacterium]